MPVTNEAQRAVNKLTRSTSQFLSAWFGYQRALKAYEANNVASDLSDVAAADIIISDGLGVTKARASEEAQLAASLLYHIEGMTDGSGNTYLGTSPLSPAQIQQQIEKLGA